jgi:hypothetical protein
MWEFFATFAGPIATVAASFAATVIAYRFGGLQAQIVRAQARTAEAQKDIAQSQLDIAYDKLKHDLFQKRYEVYQAAKGVIEYTFNSSPINVGDPRLKELRLKLDEARFFFPPDTRALCENIEKLVYEIMVADHAARGYSEDHPERARLRDNQSKSEIELSGIYPELAKKFEHDLGFEQLTKRDHPPLRREFKCFYSSRALGRRAGTTCATCLLSRFENPLTYLGPKARLSLCACRASVRFVSAQEPNRAPEFCVATFMHPRATVPVRRAPQIVVVQNMPRPTNRRHRASFRTPF